jgi:hypothetical protein
MDGIKQNSKRPFAVKLALILWGLDIGVVLVMNLIYTQWGNYVSDITFAGFLIIY